MPLATLVRVRRSCRILVALDGTAASESALREVERISAGGASVHFLYVVPVLPMIVDATSAAVMADHDRALAYLGDLRELLPDVRGIDVIRTGDPAEAILQVVREFHINLIAMGLGSVAESVARQTELPVLLKRSGLPPTQPLLRRILVPLDESEEAHSILPIATDLALRTGAEVVFLHVSDRLPGGSVDPREKLLDLAASLEKTDLVFWQTIAEGDAVEEILAHAKTLDADVIAMTGPAGEGLNETLVGRSAMAVLERTDRAILLQRPVGIPAS
jgi:nucleotide-binding universal stress UspA family protein